MQKVQSSDSSAKESSTTAAKRCEDDAEERFVPLDLLPKSADELPPPKITVHKGDRNDNTFCSMTAELEVWLPPQKVFNILCDPDNKRIFKNVDSVKSREVIAVDGQKETVEVCQVCRWKFLIFSGTFDAYVHVESDFENLKMHYYQSKPHGIMKVFHGSWQVAPLPSEPSGENKIVIPKSRVRLTQTIQPKIIPPPPLRNYVRGITVKTSERILYDLQTEALRIARREPIVSHQEQSHLKNKKLTVSLAYKPETRSERVQRAKMIDDKLRPVKQRVWRRRAKISSSSSPT